MVGPGQRPSKNEICRRPVAFQRLPVGPMDPQDCPECGSVCVLAEQLLGQR